MAPYDLPPRLRPRDQRPARARADPQGLSPATPTASYLTTAAIGRFELRSSVLPDGLPNIEAIDVDLVGDPGLAVLDGTAGYLDYLKTVYGPYPFEAIGAIVDDAEEIGYALEIQTRPIYAGVAVRRRQARPAVMPRPRAGRQRGVARKPGPAQPTGHRDGDH